MALSFSRFDKWLWASAAAAILAAAGAVTWSQFAISVPPQYTVGERFDSVPAFEASSTSRSGTLILWLDSRCKPCSDTMPFYQQLTSQAHRARIVVMGSQSVEELNAYVVAHGVKPTDVISTGTLALKFRATPTVAFLGTDAIVKGIWCGKRDIAAAACTIAKIVN